jgi:HD-GYP domain-containing protein (c-di-GMP phosphodiesterase class II)
VRGHTASAGVAALEANHGPEGLLAAARSALERAQAAGGARAVLHAAPSDTEGEEAELAGIHGDVVAALASTIGERGRAGVADAESVVEAAAAVADGLGLDGDRARTLRTAALLHDIGKVGVPEEIVNKPDALDESEWEIMRQHPVIGERIIAAIPGMAAVARIVRHEHERWDGNGYPDGLQGTQIPFEARIILACDAYHALTSDRPYRSAVSHEEALTELTTNSGTQFDPEVVETLVAYLYGRRQSGLAAV